jgi:hypothetical protein
VIVPLLPPLEPEVVVAHERAHDHLASAFRSAERSAQRLFVMVQRRIVVESLAYVQPVSANADQQLIIPPPRAFLSRSKQRRMQGADAAFRHLDSRSAMRQLGSIAAVLHRTTPVVLHALLEGPAPSDRETNPGMLRVTPTSWKPEASSYIHPPAAVVPELVDASVRFVLEAPAPACVRASWLTFTMLSIHPFVDGNGRTSRALAMAVMADELALGIDWGLLEQWSVRRWAYIEALQAGQAIPEYDPLTLDPRPFIEFSTTMSIDGAVLCLQRLQFIGHLVDDAGRRGLSGDHALVYVAVQLLDHASMFELESLGLSAVEVTEIVDGLARSGLVRWAARPPSRRTADDPDRHALVVC